MYGITNGTLILKDDFVGVSFVSIAILFLVKSIMIILYVITDSKYSAILTIKSLITLHNVGIMHAQVVQ